MTSLPKENYHVIYANVLKTNQPDDLVESWTSPIYNLIIWEVCSQFCSSSNGLNQLKHRSFAGLMFGFKNIGLRTCIENLYRENFSLKSKKRDIK